MSLIAAAAIAGGAALVSGIASAISNKKNNDRQLEQSEYWNKQQQQNWQKEFDYQKYLNENQYQMQAVDMAKAGINPIAGNSGALQGFSGNISPDTADTRATDFSFIGEAVQAGASMYMQGLQLKQQKAIADQQMQTQKDIADINAESAKAVATINASATRYSADSGAGASIHNAELDSATRKYIANMDDKTKRDISQAERELRERIDNADNATRRDIADWANQTQVALQNASQNWQDSQEHADAMRELENQLLLARKNHLLNVYADNATVTVDVDGTPKNLTLDDAIKYYQMVASRYGTQTRWVMDIRDTVFGAVNSFANVAGGLSGYANPGQGYNPFNPVSPRLPTYTPTSSNPYGW